MTLDESVPEVPAAAESKPKNVKFEVHPDATKSLPTLSREWQGCVKCNLGRQREAMNGSVVCGGGKPRGILFVGESPGYKEENVGYPYADNSGGRLLQKCITRYKIRTFFATYLVGCRSCAPVFDNEGLPKRYPGRNGNPGGFIFQNQPPSQIQLNACAPRLYEEIYIVDPIVIVAMGQAAASFLAGTSINIKKLRGSPLEIEVPGAGDVAVFSEKKHEWYRKVKGVGVTPTKQNVVRYMMIPTYDVGFASEHRHDTTSGNAFRDFTKDVFLAKLMYDRYHEEVSGTIPEAYEMDVPDEILDEMEQEDANDG